MPYRLLDGVLLEMSAEEKAALVPPPPTVEQALGTLAAYRFAHETAGVMFQASGAAAPSPFATDRDSQGKVVAAFVAAAAGKWVDGSVWKCSDGTFVALTAADVETLAVKIQTYVQLCFAREDALAPAVQADPTTDITGGWPSNL